jgi:hypothetical protein
LHVHHFKEHDDFSKRRGDGDMFFRKKRL